MCVHTPTTIYQSCKVMSTYIDIGKARVYAEKPLRRQLTSAHVSWGPQLQNRFGRFANLFVMTLSGSHISISPSSVCACNIIRNAANNSVEEESNIEGGRNEGKIHVRVLAKRKKKQGVSKPTRGFWGHVPLETF